MIVECDPSAGVYLEAPVGCHKQRCRRVIQAAKNLDMFVNGEQRPVSQGIQEKHNLLGCVTVIYTLTCVSLEGVQNLQQLPQGRVGCRPLRCVWELRQGWGDQGVKRNRWREIAPLL